MQYAIAALLILWLLYRLRKQGGAASSKTSIGGMSKAEARLILGVAEDATMEDVEQAYKHLLKKLHPDTGGSDYLTQQIIQAKKVLEDE